MQNPLVSARKASGLTQAQLAAQSGVHIRTIQKYESGEHAIKNMPLINALGISAALGITPQQLLPPE